MIADLPIKMAKNNGVDPRFAATDDSAVQIDDVKLSLEGINLMLNNGFRESQEIFDKFKWVIKVINQTAPVCFCKNKILNSHNKHFKSC